jgi:hypothetical protein
MAASTGDANTCGIVVKDPQKWIELLVNSCLRQSNKVLHDGDIHHETDNRR